MAFTKGFAVKVVTELGIPVINVTSNAPPATVCDDAGEGIALPGVPIVIVTDFGTPLVLYDEDGVPYP